MPSDGGLYVPSETEDLRRWILDINENTPFSSIAGTLTNAFIKEEFSPIICETIATRAFPFSPEFKTLDENLFLLELTNTPTGTHRDFGISFLTACFDTILQLRGQKATIVGISAKGELCASLAWAVRDKPNLKVVILCLKGTVRGVEERDCVWNGGNIYPIEIDGTEELLHNLARQLFADQDYVKAHKLTLANTANIGRLLPQAFFYPYAFSRLKNKVHSDIYYAMAAGNYSNVVAGMYAWQFALPLSGFFVPATDAFTVNPGGNPIILDSLVPIEDREPADPAEPSNLERLESVFSANKLMMRHFIYPVEISEEEVDNAAKELFMKYKVIADRHTARAYASVLNQQALHDEEFATVIVARDHPCLSENYVRQTIGEVPETPVIVKASLQIMNPGRSCVTSLQEIKKIISSL